MAFAVRCLECTREEGEAERLAAVPPERVVPRVVAPARQYVCERERKSKKESHIEVEGENGRGKLRERGRERERETGIESES